MLATYAVVGWVPRLGRWARGGGGWTVRHRLGIWLADAVEHLADDQWSGTPGARRCRGLIRRAIPGAAAGLGIASGCDGVVAVGSPRIGSAVAAAVEWKGPRVGRNGRGETQDIPREAFEMVERWVSQRNEMLGRREDHAGRRPIGPQRAQTPSM